MRKESPKIIYRKNQRKTPFRKILIAFTAIFIFFQTSIPVIIINFVSDAAFSLFQQVTKNSTPIVSEATGKMQRADSINSLVPTYQVFVTNENSGCLQAAYQCDQVYETSIFIDNIDDQSMRVENVRLKVLEYTPIENVEFLFHVDLGGGSEPPLAFYYTEVEPTCESFFGIKISDKAFDLLNADTENVPEVLLDNQELTNITNISGKSYCEICFLFTINEPGVYKYIIEADYTLGGHETKTVSSRIHTDAFLEPKEYKNKVIDICDGMISGATPIGSPLDGTEALQEWHTIKTDFTQENLQEKLQKSLPNTCSVREEYYDDQSSILMAVVDDSTTNECFIWYVNDTININTSSYETINMINTSSGTIFLAKQSSDEGLFDYSIIQERYGFPVCYEIYGVQSIQYLGNDLFELVLLKYTKTGMKTITTQAFWNGICFEQPS